jgi:hypothetical protein
MIHMKRPMRRRHYAHLTDERFEKEIQHSQEFINEQISEVLASQEKQLREMTEAIGRLANEVGALKAKSEGAK